MQILQSLPTYIYINRQFSGSKETHFVVGRISVLLVGKYELLALQNEVLGADLEAGGLGPALPIAHVHYPVVKLLKKVNLCNIIHIILFTKAIPTISSYLLKGLVNKPDGVVGQIVFSCFRYHACGKLMAKLDIILS